MFNLARLAIMFMCVGMSAGTVSKSAKKARRSGDESSVNLQDRGSTSTRGSMSRSSSTLPSKVDKKSKNEIKNSKEAKPKKRSTMQPNAPTGGKGRSAPEGPGKVYTAIMPTEPVKRRSSRGAAPDESGEGTMAVVERLQQVAPPIPPKPQSHRVHKAVPSSQDGEGRDEARMRHPRRSKSETRVRCVHFDKDGNIDPTLCPGHH